MISFRKLAAPELSLIEDIDRTERIRIGYEVSDGKLVEKDVDWDAPNFIKDGVGEHSIAHQVEFCQGHMARNAISIGAFEHGVLVGIGVLTPDIRPGMGQLAYLQVSAHRRRRGIGSAIARQLLQHARDRGSKSVYVSATPSESAVGFYRSLGFDLVEEPLPELYELEPEDIHMVVELDDARRSGSA
jgi:GNAT superfamily N-acetyltransferase